MSSQKSTIEITFTRDAVALETISFDRKNVSTLDVLTATSTFVSGARVKNGQIPILTNTGLDGEAEAIGYEKYFNIDHNTAGLMSISRAGAVVTIDINIDWEIENFTNTVGATSSITARGPQAFELISASLAIHPTEPCDKVDVDILTSIQATGYSYQLGNVPIIAATTNPFTVPVDRTVPTNIYIHRSGEDSISVVPIAFNEPHLYFRKIFDANVSFNIETSGLSGATVTVNVSYGSLLEQRPLPVNLQYSLDNVTFQSSSVFTGQVDGDYTIYIKDNLGCTFQKDFSVSTGSSGRDAFIDISNVNSVTFSKDEIWDGLQDGIHKNPDNVLALTDRQKHLFDERLIYRVEDEIRIQFKSNYDNNFVTLETCEGNAIQYEPTVEKMSQNLNLFESLDAKIFSYGNGVTAVYYTSGSVYNESEIVIDTFELNGNLPDSAYVGNVIRLGGLGVHEITNLVYDEDKDKFLMLFDLTTSDVNPSDIVTRAYYDLLPFEIYEFSIDFSSVVIQGDLDNLVRVRIQSTDDLYDEVNHYSEYISILDEYDGGLEKYVAIKYFNNNNRDIFYLYGITHFIRAEVLRTNSIIVDDSDIVKGDDSTYLTESVVHEGIDILFSDVTYRVMLKIVLALSSENLFINGKGYVKNDGIEVTPIDNTNLYSIQCNLLSTNRNFSTVINSETGHGEDYKTIYIPKLIGTGSKYIKA